jgi:uncharacterized membrane protein
VVQLLALIATMLRGCSVFILKIGVTKSVSRTALFSVYYAAGSIICGWWTWYKGLLYFDLKTILVGVILGFSTLAATECMLLALKRGPGGVTSSLINANAIFTILLAVCFFGEQPAIFALLGVLLIIFGVILLPIDFNQKLRITNKKWYYYVLLGTILFFPRNGGLKLIVHYGMCKEMVLFLANVVAFIYFGTVLVLKKNKGNVNSLNKKVALVGFLAGANIALSMNFYAAAVEKGSGQLSQIAAIFSATGLVVALLARIFCKERLSLIQICSMLAIVGGTVFIALA